MDRIKIFLSSAVDDETTNKFSNLRKELKRDLESLDLFNIYIFECGYGTSKNVVHDYLDELYHSDLCLFLIDRSEGVPDGVLKEIQDAVKYDKPQIYIINKNSVDEELPIESELKTPNSGRIKLIDSFEEYYQECINSIKSEVVKIYRDYSYKMLTRNSNGKINEEELLINSVNVGVKKTYLSGFLKTKTEVARFLYPGISIEAEKTSNSLDGYLADLFKMLIGQKKITEFNSTFFLEELKNTQSNEMFEVVSGRWKAIEFYQNGSLEKFIEVLEEVYKKACEKDMPTWIRQDILIDLRNKRALFFESKNKWEIESNPQKELNETDEMLVYPSIDRVSKQLLDRLNKKRKSELLKKPYSINYDNLLSDIVDSITSILAIATYYGSLTHFEMIINHLRDINLFLIEIYSDWEFKMNYLKTTIYLTDKKDLELVLMKFNKRFNRISSKDAFEVIEFVKRSPHPLTANKNILLALSKLGYFLEENKFNVYLTEVERGFQNWIDDEDRNVKLGDYYFSFFESNIERISQELIVNYINMIFKMKMYRYANALLKVLSKIDYKTVPKTLIEELLKNIDEFEDRKSLLNNKMIRVILLSVRNHSANISEIDSSAQTLLINSELLLYNNWTKQQSRDSYNVFTDSITAIENANKTSRAGVYSVTGYDYFSIIKSSLFNIDLRQEDKKRLIELLFETIISENNSSEAKVKAIQLLIYLKNNEEFDDLGGVFQKIKENQENIYNFNESFYLNHSIFAVAFNYMLLNMVFNEDNGLDISLISDLPYKDITDKLNVSKAVRNYLYNIKSTVPSTVETIIYILKNSENEQVRANNIYSIIYYIKCNSYKEQQLITELTKMMEYETVLIKNIILKNISTINEYNNEVAEYIMQKAKLDNHYIIKKQCENIQLA